MLDDLVIVLQRELDAVLGVERRLRSLELLLAAGDDHLVEPAVDEASAAIERLAAVELTRCLSLTSAGLAPDLGVEQLRAHVPSEAGDRYDHLVGQLRAAAGRVAVRVEHVRSRLPPGLQTDLPTTQAGEVGATGPPRSAPRRAGGTDRS